jgi:uncharacterized protein (UPF0212 family)
MKCPHCGKDIPERLVVSEAARVHRRKGKKTLTTEEAQRIANARWHKDEKEK